MRISRVEMKNFKFFDDLTIEVPNDKWVILLVGPNGCGKSCVFDAFTNYARPAKIGNEDTDTEYLRKDKDNPHDIKIFDENGSLIDRSYRQDESTKFYGRTAYRFTKDITRTSVTQNAGNALKTDRNSFERFNDLDQRIEDDIEAALGEYLTKVQEKGQRTDDVIDSVMKPVNKSLKNIFGNNGIQVQSILNPFDKKGSNKIDVLFIKNKTEFLYKNLSAGEKEVFDIIFNFYRRVDFHIKEGIYFIDEPELHIHTNIQKRLLKELSNLCRINKAQLWVATHSIGFIRAAHNSKDKNICIYKLSSKLANGFKTIKPIKLDWKGWQRVFKISLDDLATLTLPKKIIYCEGNPQRTGFDEKIYNIIFGKKYPDSLFISSGGRTQPLANSLLAAKVFQKLSADVQLLILKDRDEENMTDKKRDKWLKDNSGGRMLERLEIENYLFDLNVLRTLNSNIKEDDYKKIIKDINQDDLKKVKQKIKKLCGDKSSNCEKFLIKLAEKLTKTQVYNKLEKIIFYQNGKIKTSN